jgi:hypothetical protein
LGLFGGFATNHLTDYGSEEDVFDYFHDKRHSREKFQNVHEKKLFFLYFTSLDLRELYNLQSHLDQTRPQTNTPQIHQRV